MTMKRINLLGIRKQVVLRHFEGFKGGSCAVMRAITLDEEKTIDRTKSYRLENGASLDTSSIYFYGDIDITNEADIDLIRHKNLINEDCQIRSNFDYDKGEHDVIDQVRYSVVNDVIKWFKYNYCMLGKPERVIVFKIPKAYLR